MTISLIVRDIEANVHEIKEYVNFSIYFSSKNDFIRMTEIHKKMHLMKELKVNMLIKNDILKSKKFIINVQKKKTIICNCEDMIIEMKIHQREFFVRRNVISQFFNVISSESYVKILYNVKDLSSNRDFLFEFFFELSIFIYAHVIDARTIEVIVRNEFEKFVEISRNFKLSVAQEIQYEDCFYASQKHQLALQTFKKNSIIEKLKVELMIKENKSRSSSKNSKIRVIADQIDEKFEKKISFEITAFDDEEEKQKFDKLINKFSEI
jgi:hypothetical protein